MLLIGEEDLKALGCKDVFANWVDENLGLLPVYEKVIELMFAMQTDDTLSVQDVFGSLLEITRLIEEGALQRVTAAVEPPERPAFAQLATHLQKARAHD
ncbi:MAG: hypothetical protein ACYCYO_08315 [Bacilli bacterium]